MSLENIRAMEELARNYRKNMPLLQKKLRKAGLKADPAVMFTVAIYYDCLTRLANE